MNYPKSLFRGFLVTAILLSFQVQPSLALDYSRKFSTCTQMKKVYRFGVALNQQIAGRYPAKVSRLIYIANEGLDFDYDGIVCENNQLQQNLNPSVSPSTTAASSPTTITTIVPLPTSPEYVGFRNGGTLTLRRGVTYQIYLCADGPGVGSYMDYLSIKTGWTQKAVGVDLLDATRCSSPGFPYRTSHGWYVTENPGEISRVRFRGWIGDLQMTVVITN